MDGEELSVQMIGSSLMHNGKMEFHMDTIDGFLMKVPVINMNIKMAQKLEILKNHATYFDLVYDYLKNVHNFKVLAKCLKFC